MSHQLKGSRDAWAIGYTWKTWKWNTRSNLPTLNILWSHLVHRFKYTQKSFPIRLFVSKFKRKIHLKLYFTTDLRLTEKQFAKPIVAIFLNQNTDWNWRCWSWDVKSRMVWSRSWLKMTWLTLNFYDILFFWISVEVLVDVNFNRVIRNNKNYRLKILQNMTFIYLTSIMCHQFVVFISPLCMLAK